MPHLTQICSNIPMTQRLKRRYALGLLLLFTPLAGTITEWKDYSGRAEAKEVIIKVANSMTVSDSVMNNSKQEFSDLPPTGYEEERESLFPSKSRNLGFSHFTWGAEFGSSIDCTANNMSTFDVDALIGYKNSFLQLLGFGAGLHRSIYDGTNYVPVYAVIRTDFRKASSPCFLHVQGGYSFNTFKDSPTFGDISTAAGLGVNLHTSRVARSYLILGGGFRYFNHRHRTQISLNRRFVIIAKLSFGVNF